jgi:hypothetical protein
MVFTYAYSILNYNKMGMDSKEKVYIYIYIYCNKFAGSIHNGSLLHSRLNTQLLITISNSSRILTHV